MGKIYFILFIYRIEGTVILDKYCIKSNLKNGGRKTVPWMFGVRQCLGSDTVWSQTMFGVRQYLGSDNAWSQTMFRVRQYLGSDNGWDQTMLSIYDA